MEGVFFLGTNDYLLMPSLSSFLELLLLDGQAILLAIKALAVIVLAIWMARSGTRLAAIGLGLIIGGAIGNAVDRVIQGGAVIDFVRLHAVIGGVDRDWYVFNVADAAIVAGVAGLLYESVRPDRAAKVP